MAVYLLVNNDNRIVRETSTGNCLVSGTVTPPPPPGEPNAVAALDWVNGGNQFNVNLAINIEDAGVAATLAADPDANVASNWTFETFDADGTTKLSSPGEYEVFDAYFGEGTYIRVTVPDLMAASWGRKFKAYYKGGDTLRGWLFTVSSSTGDVQTTLPTAIPCIVQDYPQAPGDRAIAPNFIEWIRIAWSFGSRWGTIAGALGNGVEAIIPNDGSGHRVVSAYLSDSPPVNIMSEPYLITMFDNTVFPSSTPVLVHYSLFTALPI